MDILFGITILALSVILHEVSHGYMANLLGDPTARLAGRLTLNPLKHVDPVGTILLPLLLWAGQGFSHAPLMIGYAKPVPYNPYNLRGRFGEGLVAFAGPGVNLLLAVIFGSLIRLFEGSISPSLVLAFATIAYLNLLLGIFNLIPIPPLDGSKVLSALLPGALGRGYDRFRMSFERLGVFSGTLILLVIFYVLSPFFTILLQTLFGLLVGGTF